MKTSSSAKKKENGWEMFALGGLSCMAAACVTNPVEVVKTRMQLAGGGGGAIREAALLHKHEGLRGFYRGLSPSLLRESTYSTIRVGGYEWLKARLGDWDTKAAVPLWAKIVAGAGSGLAGSGLVNPTDLLRVRFQSSDLPAYRHSASVFHCFVRVAREEGLRTLYRGAGPTMVRAAVLTSSQMASYDHTKQTLLAANLGLRDGLPLFAVCSLVSGFVAAYATSPLDVVKTRVMAQPSDSNGRPVLYSGMLDCFAKVLRNEGTAAFWRGVIPNALRIAPHTIVTFIVFEQLRLAFGFDTV